MEGDEVALPYGRLDEDCARLTRRENQLMRCFAKGLLYKETSAALGISFSAVHKHQQSIFRKFGVANRTEALAEYLGLARY